MNYLTVSCLQLNSGDDIDANTRSIAPLVKQAKEEGAQLALLPENAFFMEAPGSGKRPRHAESEHQAVAQAQAWAKEQVLWLLIGSVQVMIPPEERLFNRSLLISPTGEITARYDKIHLFDVTLPGGENYTESAKCAPGEKGVVADTPWGKLGLSICYDIRFPHLYRALALAGASILTIPAAFTKTTGQAHWHVLNRARAIENACFVLSPAQCGVHPGGRKTYGHALIVSPWGEVMADAGDEPGVITATLDLTQVEEVRARIPSLQHGRKFSCA